MTIGDIAGVNRYCSQLVSSIWRFPTIVLELNLDLILSGSGSAGIWYFSTIDLELNLD